MMDESETRELLRDAVYGVLSMVDEDGCYGVPLNHVLVGDTIYFHCAMTGRKLDALTREERVCFTVVDRVEVIPEKTSTHYRSAMGFGKAYVVEDREEWRTAMVALCEKYLPGGAKDGADAMERAGHVTAVVGIKLYDISGKANR